MPTPTLLDAAAFDGQCAARDMPSWTTKPMFNMLSITSPAIRQFCAAVRPALSKWASSSDIPFRPSLRSSQRPDCAHSTHWGLYTSKQVKQLLAFIGQQVNNCMQCALISTATARALTVPNKKTGTRLIYRDSSERGKVCDGKHLEAVQAKDLRTQKGVE